MTWKKYIVFLVLLCLFCCSPPLVFSQSTTGALDESWQAFDSLILDLQNGLQGLSKDNEELSNISKEKYLSWIKSLATDLALKSEESKAWQARYNSSESGRIATETLNKQLSKDLRQARVTNGILIGVATGLSIGLVYALTH
jgi:hypothetical protein